MGAGRIAALLLALLPGCGEVAALDGGNCTAGMHLGYSGSCERNCTAGSCGTDATCNETSGQCEYASCYHLKQAVADLTDGVYPVRPVSSMAATQAYCAGNWSYEGLGFGNYNQDLGNPYTGWAQLRVSDLQSDITQAAFVASYNRQGGLRNISPGFRGTECCFKSAYDGMGDITVGGVGLTPANLDGQANCGGPYTDATMLIASAPATLPSSFFSEGVSLGAQCPEADNPAFFAKRYTGLASCAAINDANLWEGPGIYVVDPDGISGDPPEEAVCGVAGGDTLFEVAVGVAGTTYPNYEQITSTQLADPSVQLAFLLSYGRNNGLRNLAPGFNVSSCCLLSNNNMTLSFGGATIEIVHETSATACTSEFNDQTIRISRATVVQDPPLARNYFAGNAVGQAGTGCAATGSKPALFLRRT